MDTGGDIPAPPRLLDRVRDKIRLLHYSIRTEQAYVDWIKRYIISGRLERARGCGARRARRVDALDNKQRAGRAEREARTRT